MSLHEVTVASLLSDFNIQQERRRQKRLSGTPTASQGLSQGVLTYFSFGSSSCVCVSDSWRDRTRWPPPAGYVGAGGLRSEGRMSPAIWRLSPVAKSHMSMNSWGAQPRDKSIRGNSIRDNNVRDRRRSKHNLFFW